MSKGLKHFLVWTSAIVAGFLIGQAVKHFYKSATEPDMVISLTVNEDGTVTSNDPNTTVTKVDESLQPTREQLMAALEAGDETLLNNYAAALGMDVENLKGIAQEIKEYEVIYKKRRAREETLGTWQEALEKGKIVRNSVDQDGDIVQHYDVNGDGIGDFEFLIRGNGEKLWRYLDENGEAYG